MLFGLNGWGVLLGLSLKKCFILLDLSNFVIVCDMLSLFIFLLGTNVRPLASTWFCAAVRFFEDRFVMYLSCCVVLFAIVLSGLLNAFLYLMFLNLS